MDDTKLKFLVLVILHVSVTI